MIPEQIKSTKDFVNDSIRDIENAVAQLNEEIQKKEAELTDLNTRKASFLQVKDTLVADKAKLEAGAK